LKLLIDYVSDPVIVVDEEAKIVGINKALAQRLDYSVDEYAGKYIREVDCLSEDDKCLIIENEKNRLVRKNIAPYEVKITAKTQEPFLVEVKGNIIKDEGETYDLVILHDVTERARNEKTLKQNLIDSEEKFQSTIHSIREAIILVDEKAIITYWNPAAEKIFGYTKEEVIGKKIHDLVAPKSLCKEAKERIETSVKIFTETGAGYFTVTNVQVVGCRKDLTEFPVQLSLSPIMLNGKWNAIGVVKDITNKKQADHKLRDTEQRYHTLFNQAPIGVLVVDPETTSFVEFNNVAHIQLGYTREEFEKLKIADINADDNQEQIRKRIAEIVEKGFGDFETIHKTKYGEKRNVIITVKPFQSAGKLLLQCIFHDITENKKTENALMESETHYRQLVEVAQEGIWAIDLKFDTVFVNSHMAQMLGYTDSEMLGKSFFHFVDPTMVETIEVILKQFGTLDSKCQYDYAFPRKDGKRIETTVNLSRITDDKGQMSGILIIVLDITERKRIEKALKESEELSRAIVANAPIGIATSDIEYHFLSANQAFCSILGYTEEELKGLTFKEITHPEGTRESLEKMSALEKGEIQYFQLEKRYLKKDGAVIVGRVIINALRDLNGNPVLFIVELEDITKRKQLEEDVLDSEEKFRVISSSALDAIVLIDEEDNVIYWNPAAEKMFGFSTEEAVGCKITKLVMPSHALAKHQELMKEMMENIDSKKRLYFNAARRDGTRFPIDLSVVSTKLKGKNCLLAIVRDITESKALEEALRQERDMLESVATSIQAGLTIVSKDFKILWANKLMRQVSGSENLENINCYSVYNYGACKVCEGCGVKKIFEEGLDIYRRDWHAFHNGQDRWVELISTPIKDKEGNVVAALEFSLDITERKLMQNKLSDYSQRLEEIVQQRSAQLKKTQADLVKSERLAAIGELAGMVGHDLRNPLTGIKNSAYFLKKKGADISEVQTREMLETINKCVDYSNRIVNDLLDYSRDIHLELKQESLDKLLAESLAILDLPQKITIQNRLQDKPKVTVDPDKMKRVFINLVKNAVDAMPTGGIITVDSVKVDGNMEICVADNGPGISEGILPKLFTPLCTTKAQGMGFGLAICKRIVDAHGGKISVETITGKGTRFTITIPITQKDEDGGEKIWINMPEYSLSTTTKPSGQQ
jgi:PAS domain S-box-containing protein